MCGASFLACEFGQSESFAVRNRANHQLRDLTVMVRKRKLKPEKGRRKDLRKLNALITDLHLFLPEARAK